MNSLLSNRKIDVVDFDGLKLFMFKNDNLYDNFIPKHRKDQSLDQYIKSVNEARRYPTPSINYRNCEQDNDPRNGLFIYFKHLLDQNVEFTVLDIGSHVGDFAIKCGHFFRDAGKDINVISFDPSPAGMLVPFNIEINGLTAYNKHEPLAVTERNGFYIFHFKERDTDSAKLSISKQMDIWQKVKFYWNSSLKLKLKVGRKLFTSVLRARQKSFDLIVKGISLENYLTDNGINHSLFAKVDVEGYDEILVRELIRLKKDKLISIITELHVDANSLSFLDEITSHFFIFDLFYCPNPTRFKMIAPENFADFVNRDLKNREFGYTDLFLLDKNTPDVVSLVKKLTSLRSRKDEMVL